MHTNIQLQYHLLYITFTQLTLALTLALTLIAAKSNTVCSNPT